jgi:Fur family ferric uptake transcriptional regulator
VLGQLQAAGFVARHHFETGMAVFELKQSAHHDHLLCMRCGRIEEFADDEIEARQVDIARRLGHDLDDHSLVLYGTYPPRSQKSSRRFWRIGRRRRRISIRPSCR